MQTRLWWCLWWNLGESALGGSLKSGGRFCVGTYGSNPDLVAIKMFSQFCTFNTASKNNAAIHVINVQGKKYWFRQLLGMETL
jgi:hypothetical protein